MGYSLRPKTFWSTLCEQFKLEAHLSTFDSRDVNFIIRLQSDHIVILKAACGQYDLRVCFVIIIHNYLPRLWCSNKCLQGTKWCRRFVRFLDHPRTLEDQLKNKEVANKMKKNFVVRATFLNFFEQKLLSLLILFTIVSMYIFYPILLK